MRPRQITLFGWSVEDDLRADALAAERAAAVPDGPVDEEAPRGAGGDPTPRVRRGGPAVRGGRAG